MDITKPKGITTKSTWNLDLEKAQAVEHYLALIETCLGHMQETWRSIRCVDAGDGRDVTLKAFASLEQPEQNKAIAYAVYALHSEFVHHLRELHGQVESLHNDPWEGLFQLFTDTSPNPNRDTQ